MKKIRYSLVLTAMILCLLLFSFAGCEKYRDFAWSGVEKGSVDLTLELGEDGKFDILQLTDIQFVDYVDDRSVAVMSAAISYADPDLIVITGDQISPEYLVGQKKKTKKILNQITAFFDSKQIPWTVCFGNHDGAMGVISKKEMVEIYQKSAFFIGGLTESDYCESYINEKEDTYCNYFIPVYEQGRGAVAHGVFIMDCATSLMSPYDGFTSGQIDFYNSMSKKYPGVNISMYTHEPTQEFQTMYDNRNDKQKVGIFKGEIEKPERGKTYYPTKDSAANERFSQSLKNNNNVRGIYVGHDHLSNFAGVYNIGEDNSIILAYGRMSTYGFGEWRYFMFNSSDRKQYKNYPRGGRTVTVSVDGGYTTRDILDSKDGKYTMTSRNEITISV